MQVLLMVIEAFLPEFASTLAGPQSRKLRLRLLRAGIAILLVCSAYLVVALVYRYLFSDARDLSTLLPVYEIVLLGILSAFGIALLLLSSTEASQALPPPFASETTPSSTTVIEVHGVFGSEGGCLCRKVRSPSFRERLQVFKGANPEDVWLIVVDGIQIQVSYSVTTNVWMSHAPLDLQIPLSIHGSWTNPKLRMRLVDTEGGTRDVEIVPKGILTPSIVVSINGLAVPSG
jgi:hypothetical protein